jgi:hypothetical protein
MPSDSKPDQPQIYEDALRNFILLTLPWLCFQGRILEIAKKGITDASATKPTENFVLGEMQALRMILDPSRTWRNRVDSDFENRVEAAYKELFPKVASASVQLIEAQEIILMSISDALNALRKGDKAKSHPKSRH